MLIELRVKNFRSFKDEQVLSLVAGHDKTLSENCVRQNRLTLLKAVAIYGPNGSGKSNLIKAMDLMRDLVLDSAEYKPNRTLGMVPYLLDANSARQPTTLEVTFYHEAVRYQYGFSATDNRVEEEWLIAYPKGVGQTWYERAFNRKKSRYDWTYSSFLKGERAKLADKTRDNALFLSVAAQWNHAQLGSVYEWFRNGLRVVDSKHDLVPVTATMLTENREKRVKDPYRRFVHAIMKQADLGISGVTVRKKKVDPATIHFPEAMPNELRAKFLQRFTEQFVVEILHRNCDTGKNVHIPLEEESDGTQEFFKLIGPWMQACALGITVFIDELEASLHPLLTRELVRLVQFPTSKAQLVFATHDTTLLDPELFRRDQIWFTEKDKRGETRLCTLSDYRPRKGEAMQKGYLSGRYGAVPIIERFRLE